MSTGNRELDVLIWTIGEQLKQVRGEGNVTKDRPIPGQLAIDGFEDVPFSPSMPPPARPRWTEYRSTPTKCDDCLTVLAAAKGHGPATRPARWRRVAVDGSDLLLCYPHAQHRRAGDGMKPLRGA